MEIRVKVSFTYLGKVWLSLSRLSGTECAVGPCTLAMCRTEQMAQTKAIMSIFFSWSQTTLSIPEEMSLMTGEVFGF